MTKIDTSDQRVAELPRVWRRRLETWGRIALNVLLIVALVALVIWALLQIRLVVIPLLLAAFLASLGTPVAGRLRRLGIPSLLATWTVTVLALLLVTGVVWFIVSQIAATADQFVEAFRDAWDRVRQWLETSPLVAGEQVQQQLEGAFDRLAESSGAIIQHLASGAGIATEIIAGFLLMAVIAFFLIKDGDRFWQWILAKVPEHRREDVDQAGITAWSTLRRYLAGTAAVGVVDATAIAIVLLILGVPLVIPLALLMFVGAFFPLVGAIVSGAFITLITLAVNGLTDALIVAAAVIVIQQVEGDVAAPVLMGQAVALHPLVIILAITAGAVLLGIIGAFLAVPIVGIVAQVTRALRPGTFAIDEEAAREEREPEEQPAR